MKKFTNFCILFALYVYTTYIVEDWSIYNKAGRIYYYLPWFFRACLIWAISPLLIPDYFWKNSALYKELQKIQNSPEYQAQLYKTLSMFNL